MTTATPSRTSLRALLAIGTAGVVALGTSTAVGGGTATAGAVAQARTSPALATSSVATTSARPEVVTIPVHFRFVTKGRKGRYPKTRAKALIAYANTVLAGKHTAGAPTGFRLRLGGVRYVESRTWHAESPNYDEVFALTAKHRVAGAGTLTVFGPMTRDWDKEAYGYASFPWRYDESPDQDNMRLSDAVLDGGDPAWGAKIFVHELGHWLGLRHTYAGGCKDPGDRVKDTPAHQAPDVSSSDDTCPDQPGKDPLDNFMNTLWPDTPPQLTPGQTVRMQTMYARYRAS